MKAFSCQICGRQLKDANSIARGFGPECAARRASFLASCGTSEEELAAIANHENPLVRRWANNFYQDMRKGRIRNARKCLESGRYQLGRFGASLVVPHTSTGHLADVMPSPNVSLGAFGDGSISFTMQSRGSNDDAQPCAAMAVTIADTSTVAVNTVKPATAAPVTAAVAEEPPTPAIVVRESARGFRVHPPFKNPPFIAAFKKTVGSAWYPDSSEWFIPAEKLEWVKELLEYWFKQPVYVARSSEQGF